MFIFGTQGNCIMALPNIQLSVVAVMYIIPSKYREKHYQPPGYVHCSSTLPLYLVPVYTCHFDTGGVKMSCVSTLNCNNLNQDKTLLKTLKAETLQKAWHYYSCFQSHTEKLVLARIHQGKKILVWIHTRNVVVKNNSLLYLYYYFFILVFLSFVNKHCNF